MKNLNIKEISFPFFVIWEITNKCNSACKHCYNNSGQPRPHELEKKWIDKICDEIISNKVLKVDLIGGEPTLSPHFNHIVNKLKGHSALGLITNGIFLSDKDLIKNFSQVQVSVDGLNEDYCAIRGVDKFSQVERNLKELVKLNGPEIIVSVTLTKLNLPKIGQIIEFCLKNNVHHIKVSEFIPLGRGYMRRNDLEPSKKDYLSVKKLLKEYSNRCKIEWEFAPKIDKESNLLPITRNWIGISSEGNIMPDPFIPVPIGNIKTITIQKAWEEGKNFESLKLNTVLNNENREKILSFEKILGGKTA